MSKYIHPLHQQQIAHTKVTSPRKLRSKQSFNEILTNLTELKVSKHAEERMKQRNIKFDQNQWRQISEKVFEAKAKGVTDALVVVDDTTLIVSAKNNTVVTALGREDAKDKIFTNIDGTILL